MKSDSRKDFEDRLRNEQIIRISNINNSNEFNMVWRKKVGRLPSDNQRLIASGVLGFEITRLKVQKPGIDYKKQYYTYRGRKARSVGRKVREETTKHRLTIVKRDPEEITEYETYKEFEVRHYRDTVTGRFTLNPENYKIININRNNKNYRVYVDRKTNKFKKWVKNP